MPPLESVWPIASPGLHAALGLSLGLVVGSYLATVFVRWPEGDTAAGFSRSRCDSCGRQLRWYEIVPLLSFFVLQGRCRSCQARIGRTHLVFELLCGAAGAFLFASGNAGLAPIIWLLIALAFFDATYFWLPNALVIALGLASILAPPWQEDSSYVARLWGGAIGFTSLWFISAAHRSVRKREGLGRGDAKMFGAIGLWTGLLGLPTLLLLACLIGLVDALRRLTGGADARTVHLPFGTYLAVGTIMMVLLKSQIA